MVSPIDFTTLASSFNPTSGISRRAFLKTGIQLGAGVPLGMLFAQKVFADPFRRWLGIPEATRLISVTGQVRLANRPLAEVAVTDGRTVVRTDGEGHYALPADAAQPFVYLSLPRGTRIPRNPGQATASFYRPLQPTSTHQQVDWLLEPEEDSAHQFLVFADPQPRDASDLERYHRETIADAKALLAQLPSMPTFAVGCGDIMWDDLSLFPGYEVAMSDLDVPAFSVVGNHDLDMENVRTDERSTATFRRFFGPTYYSFDRGEVHYVVLDNVFWYGHTDAGAYMGYLDEMQLEWLRQDLAGVPHGSTVVVFTHIPMYTFLTQYRNEEEDGSIVTLNRALLYELLAPYTTHYINGHMHHTEQFTEGGGTHHTCGAACGAWWTGPICYDGTPSGYGFFTAKGSTVSWQYKGTGLPLETQIWLYKPGRDPKAPEEWVANVWGANDDWEVVWLQNGIQKGRMARRVGYDPQAVELYTGPSLPSRHGWVNPQPCKHLYYAPADTENGEIIVEARDPFGKRYVVAGNR